MAQLSSTNIFGSLTVSGTCVGPAASWTVASDARLKKNITALEGSMEFLEKLIPVNYEWLNKDTGVVQGFIAQDVEKVKPEWVKEILVPSEAGEPIKTLQMTGLEAYLVKALQEMHSVVIELQDRIKTLENK